MKLHILIVDDDTRIRNTLKVLLEEEGHETTALESGEAAVTFLTGRAVDLVFLDLMLPGMDGIQVLRQIRSVSPHTQVVMMSGQSDLSTAVQATKLGARNFLEKPLNAERVLIEISHIQRQIALEARVEALESLVDAESEIIGESPAIRRLKETVARSAPTDGRILILGESGTGKELVARAIHRQSNRKDGPFVSLNCAAIPENLVESELFGYEKGAFTGAGRKKCGRFEIADGGTLFLDEVGDMNLDTQAKLLRVLQENEAVRLGGTESYRFDVRVISATNKDLQKAIQAGRFREDLFYRLNVIPIQVPALRDRAGDISLLARHFLSFICRRTGKEQKQWGDGCLQLLESYDWPGNVRELMNFTERMVILARSVTISLQEAAEALPVQAEKKTLFPVSADGPVLSFREHVEQFEKELLTREYKAVQGNVSEMARHLKIDRANLHRKLKVYGIK